MSYTGIVNYDFLTLIQILAWGDEPAGVEFFNEQGIFIGKIYIAQGCLRGAVYKSHKGVDAFVQLVAELSNAGGTFHKVPYVECPVDMAAPPGSRIDSLLLTAIADKETEQGHVQSEEGPQEIVKSVPQEMTASHSKLATKTVTEITHSAVNTGLRQQWGDSIVAESLFPKGIREILDVYTLFNLESLMLYQGISGHLIVFTEKFWKGLFPSVDIGTLDEQGIQAHTCIMMADIVRRYVQRKCPSFHDTLESAELLELVDNAIGEATQDEKEVKIITINPEQVYDEELSMVAGFSETTLTEPSDRLEDVYRWLESRLERESAPLQYFFYPDKHTKFSASKCSDPFRVVVAALPKVCQKICVNLRYYLEKCGRELVLYSVDSLQDFQAIERSDWEDCHLTIVEHSFVGKNIYNILARIPENMAKIIVADNREYYRPYLSTPKFREQVQGVYGNDSTELARLLLRAWEVAHS